MDRLARWKNRPLASRYFIGGLCLVLAGYLLYALSVFQVFPSEVQFVVHTTSVAGLVCFALALALRLEALEKAGAAAGQQLLKQLREKEAAADHTARNLEGKAAESTLENERQATAIEYLAGELEGQAQEIKRQAGKIERQARELADMHQLLQKLLHRPEPSVESEKPEPGQLESEKKPIPEKPAETGPPTLPPPVPRVRQAPSADHEISFEAFKERYPDDEACLKFLTELKWGAGFTCRKCGCGSYTKGKKLYARRCTQCRYPESVISFTLFGNLKFPIVKAFYMTYLVSSGKDVTVDALSEMLSLRRQTCWTFKRKVKEIMQSRRHLRKPSDGWSHLILNVEEVVNEP